MDPPRYRTEARPAALNVRRERRAPRGRRGLTAIVAGLLVLVAGSRACWPPRSGDDDAGRREAPQELVKELAATRLETARERLERGRPDEALVWALAAMEANPASADAHGLAARILRETTWHFPELEMRHPLPVERLHFAGPSCLWVGLAGDQSTVVRWNLAQPRIESVMFPVPQARIRSLLPDSSGRRLVVERAGVLLLCDALTLKPLGDLGVLPEWVTPSAVVVFSADGLLLAHPAITRNGALVWQLRDAASGQSLRVTDPLPAEPRPLAAWMDRRTLRVLQADGSVLEIPVSPVEPPRTVPPSRPLALLHALHVDHCAAVVARIDHGPHHPTELAMLPDGAIEGVISGILERHPWSLQPGVWTGLLRDSPLAPELGNQGRTLDLRDGQTAPIHAGSPITAAAASGAARIVGERNGMVTVLRALPRPAAREAGAFIGHDAVALARVRSLVEALSGLRGECDHRELARLTAAERMEAFKATDFPALAAAFPELDLSPMADAFRALPYRGQVSAEAIDPLNERLARAAEDPASPAAKLAMALESEWPQWIEECLRGAREMPPVLRKLALSRIAWLQGRKADALAGWPEILPDPKQLRLREDWDGWEQADFSPAFANLQRCLDQELAALTMPENPAAEARREVAARLLDPAALRAVGQARYAAACLRAAVALAAHRENAAEALKLAVRARELGADPQPCLRAEARALTSLADYQQAHDRWIALITGQPIETHEAADYAEAAYTAFETGDPRQAMEILTTGLHRFPADADFAVRAGWVSLLTGHPDRAHRFLLAAREIGLPPAKAEHAMAMLATATAQCGFADDAAVYYQDLIGLNPDWGRPERIDALDWPDELKTTLRQLAW